MAGTGLPAEGRVYSDHRETCSVCVRGFQREGEPAERGGMIGQEVPGQSHRGQNDHHEHQKDVALVHYEQILT